MSKPRLSRDSARKESFFEIDLGEYSALCRVPPSIDLVDAGFLPPPCVDQKLTEDERKEVNQKAAEDVEERLHRGDKTLFNALLSVTLVEPKLWLGPEDSCPEEWVTAAALSAFKDQIVGEVMPKLGYGRKRRQALEFPHPQEDGAAVPASSQGSEEEPAPAA